MSRKGLTLIELIIGIIVIALSFYSLIAVFITLAPRAVKLETIDQKIYLAQEKAEEYLTRPFDFIVNTPMPDYFLPPFQRYGFQVSVAYVTETDLNSEVGYPTNYKNVKVRVWDSTEPPAPLKMVEIITLVTSNEIVY